MASAASRSRLSSRLVSRHAARYVSSRRAFSATVQDRAAQNYSMPALSPTMTEGNIAKWRLKEGDSFSAGDVLLEIETDKASMDVEAQDDGVLFKIMEQDGAKGVKVGARIAVLAEAEDDLSNLEVPAEDKKQETSQASKKEDKPAQAEESKKSEGQSAPSQSQEKSASNVDSSSQQKSGAKQGGKAQQQKYPLFPSVQQLLHENGLSNADADSIPATGPAGRLLKGDVLAYLGKIAKDYPAKSSERLQKLSHLDLSNIQLAPTSVRQPSSESQQSTAAAEEEAAAVPKETPLSLPISLTAVLATQKRVNDTLGIFLPLSVFIARASELANDDLPASSRSKPTAQDLFDSVLGLDKISPRPTTSRGNFTPLITGLAVEAPAVPRKAKKEDAIDFLAPASMKKSKPAAIRAPTTGTAVTGGQNLFSVVARPGEEIRAMEYLERMKLALETEPGRLVL